MTKRREPLTYHRALTLVAARLGWDSCAGICGVSERAVRYWSDPDCETEIRMIDAERLDRAFIAAGGDHAPFHRLFGLRLELAAREQVEDTVMRAAAAVAKEAGEAVAAFIHAAAPDATPADRREALGEAEEAIEALSGGIAALNRIDRAGTTG